MIEVSEMISIKDREALIYLRKDARMTLSKLSRATKTPVSTLFNRIKKQEENFVKKFTVLLDYRKIGYLARAYVVVKVHRKDKEELRLFLHRHKNVNSLYKVNHDYDFLTDVVFKDYVELDGFLEELQNDFAVKIGFVHHIIENIKEEHFFSEPNKAEVY